MSIHPSVCLSVTLCIVALGDGVYMAKSCTSVFQAGKFLLSFQTDTFAIGCIVWPQNAPKITSRRKRECVLRQTISSLYRHVDHKPTSISIYLNWKSKHRSQGHWRMSKKQKRQWDTRPKNSIITQGLKATNSNFCLNAEIPTPSRGKL